MNTPPPTPPTPPLTPPTPPLTPPTPPPTRQVSAVKKDQIPYYMAVIVLVLLAIVVAFWPRAATTSDSTKDIMAKIESLIESLEAVDIAPPQAPAPVAVTPVNDVAPPPAPAPVAVAPPTPTLATSGGDQPIQQAVNFREEAGGAVIREIGRPVVRDGVTWYPLFNQKGGGAITEPFNKDVAAIQANMSFIDGADPKTLPEGRLDTFTLVQRNGEPYRILAWRVN